MEAWSHRHEWLNHRPLVLHSLSSPSPLPRTWGLAWHFQGSEQGAWSFWWPALPWSCLRATKPHEEKRYSSHPYRSRKSFSSARNQGPGQWPISYHVTPVSESISYKIESMGCREGKVMPSGTERKETWDPDTVCHLLMAPLCLHTGWFSALTTMYGPW